MQEPGIFFMKDCRLWETHTRAGEKWEEERETENNCYLLTVLPIPLVLFRGKKELGMKE